MTYEFIFKLSCAYREIICRTFKASEFKAFSRNFQFTLQILGFADQGKNILISRLPPPPFSRMAGNHGNVSLDFTANLLEYSFKSPWNELWKIFDLYQPWTQAWIRGKGGSDPIPFRPKFTLIPWQHGVDPSFEMVGWWSPPPFEISRSAPATSLIWFRYSLHLLPGRILREPVHHEAGLEPVASLRGGGRGLAPKCLTKLELELVSSWDPSTFRHPPPPNTPLPGSTFGRFKAYFYHHFVLYQKN